MGTLLTGSKDYNPAMPEPQIERPGVVIVKVSGWIDQVTVMGLTLHCWKLGRDESVRLIVLEFNSCMSQWFIGDAVDAVRALSERKLTVALIKNAAGSSYQLAAACRAVVALPTAHIGFFKALDTDEGWASQHDCDQHTLKVLGGLRPAVEAERWERVLTSVVNGEQAEAMGIVDWLVTDEAALLGKFKGKVTE